MATKIIPKKSSVAAKVPLDTDLDIGELAVNLTDKKIYTKDASNQVVELGGGTGGTTDLTNLDYIGFNTTAGVTVGQGQLAWNDHDQTLDIGLAGGTTLQVGQEQHLYVKAGSNINDGSPVYASGAVGNSGRIIVDPFLADGSVDELYVIGVATQAITVGNFGYITTFGAVRGLSTNGSVAGQTWVDGTVLYASSTTAGGLTNIPPVAPNLSIPIAMVVRAHANNGTLFVRPSPGFHLSELHDVHTPAPTDGQVLAWDAANSRWQAATASSGTTYELYAENPSTPTAPVATGTNAVAIGTGADATNSNTLSFGTDSTASGQHAVAFGRDAQALGGQSVAIGNDTDSTGYQSVAIGPQARAISGSRSIAMAYSYASGEDSFAAAIANNTATYGATGANSVAIGQLAKATAANSIAIGDTALSTTANLIALGGTTDTVQISGAYSLPTADGTTGQVLTTDGAGVVTFADASGGGAALQLYAENYVSGTLPIVTGVDAFVIGRNSTASGERSVALGAYSTASGSYSLAINGSTASATNSVGILGSATQNGATAIGSNSGLLIAQAAGQGAMALGGSYASGTNSFAAAIANSTSSYGATGANSVAIGYQAKATGVFSTSVGYGTQSTSGNSMAFGRSSVASGNSSLALGFGAAASGERSVAIGNSAKATTYGKMAYAAADFGSSSIYSQMGTYVLLVQTTDATPSVLTSTRFSPSFDNQIILPNNSVYGFTGTVIARENSAQTNDFAVWEVKGGAVRAGSASTTTLGSYNINKISESTGAANWSIALSADTTNGAVAITVTGEASHDIRWVATINTTEVTY